MKGKKHETIGNSGGKWFAQIGVIRTDDICFCRILVPVPKKGSALRGKKIRNMQKMILKIQKRALKKCRIRVFFVKIGVVRFRTQRCSVLVCVVSSQFCERQHSREMWPQYMSKWVKSNKNRSVLENANLCLFFSHQLSKFSISDWGEIPSQTNNFHLLSRWRLNGFHTK